ncbi:hypothetical protein LRP30_06005 [Bradyrhizobium sp. C-145]|uniref:hypothetical protein n=1 Tax=Bradyrhizobium sp. C-145 TaxID=574727 RepID=UPI00201B94D8|nr:hypothetical protein [Bradyrhizobium sp. C-145]UQR64855.1 hypothetical protein LRP30_06005 [Bradyrhizobium sp. C-145]
MRGGSPTLAEHALDLKARCASEKIAEQSEDIEGPTMQTIRHPDGSESVRRVRPDPPICGNDSEISLGTEVEAVHSLRAGWAARCRHRRLRTSPLHLKADSSEPRTCGAILREIPAAPQGLSPENIPNLGRCMAGNPHMTVGKRTRYS